MYGWRGNNNDIINQTKSDVTGVPVDNKKSDESILKDEKKEHEGEPPPDHPEKKQCIIPNKIMAQGYHY